jgi:hypothetical protein
MRAEEYERRRQAVQAQLQADLDLIRAGYEAKLRALESLWLSSPVGAPAAGPRSETAPNETPPSETPSSETPAGAPARVSRRGDVLRDVRAVLPHLPEVFERRDVIQALGYKPPRATLYRALATLQEEEEITIVRPGDERIQTQYQRQS